MNTPLGDLGKEGADNRTNGINDSRGLLDGEKYPDESVAPLTC